MAARAIYKARLTFGGLEVPIKFYAAVEDRGIHFRLLHATDKQPVSGQLIDKTTGEPVERESVRKAYQAEDHRLVQLQRDELERLQPEACREVILHRFVDPSRIAPHYYDRPYFLGPDGNDEGYFALAAALAARKVEGLARWVMRKQSYVGALREQEGYLVLVTLRSSEEVIDVGAFSRPDTKEISKQEIQLARQLIDALKGPFEADSLTDDYRTRVMELIERKASGRVVTLRPPKKAQSQPGLADALRGSLKSVKKAKSA